MQREVGGAGGRNAARSKAAILKAAEELFAERGFDQVSLGEIATAAGLSRGTPSYFFGSKSQLYSVVLAEVFRDREDAARAACEPLIAWADSKTASPLKEPLAQAVEGYVRFLQKRPSFVRLIQREELAGGTGLREASRDSKAIEQAFARVRKVAQKRGLRRFAVQDAVLVFISLTFSPLSQRSTFMSSLQRDLDDPRVRRQHVRLVVDQLLRVLEG